MFSLKFINYQQVMQPHTQKEKELKPSEHYGKEENKLKKLTKNRRNIHLHQNWLSTKTT